MKVTPVHDIEAIERICLEKGINKNTLAQEIGYSGVSAFSSLADGKIGIAGLGKAAKFLKVDIFDLVLPEFKELIPGINSHAFNSKEEMQEHLFNAISDLKIKERFCIFSNLHSLDSHIGNKQEQLDEQGFSNFEVYSLYSVLTFAYSPFLSLMQKTKTIEAKLKLSNQFHILKNQQDVTDIEVLGTDIVIIIEPYAQNNYLEIKSLQIARELRIFFRNRANFYGLEFTERFLAGLLENISKSNSLSVFLDQLKEKNSPFFEPCLNLFLSDPTKPRLPS